MILWAALLALITSVGALLTFGSVQLGVASGLVELLAAVALFTAICAAEAST